MKNIYDTDRCRTLFGDDLEGFKNDEIFMEIEKCGIYAKSEITILTSIFSLMSSKGVALDIGSNIGNHCGFFSRYFQETHAIEPHLEVFQVLCRNIERNTWKAKAYNIGFSDQTGIVELFISENGNLGMTSLSARPENRRVEVFVTKGDAFIRENVFMPIDFIKIDVEEHEGQVIKGLATTIEEFQPIISLEWNNQTTMYYFQQHDIFNKELKGYHRLAIYPRWRRDLWPGIFGKVRRKIDKILAKPEDFRYCLSAFETEKETGAVVLIPPKYATIIGQAQTAYPRSRLFT